ncbi:hypothetical protein ACMSFF_26295 [Bacteroides faecis]
MKNKTSIWLSSFALFFALLAMGFTFCRTTPMEADWLGILVGILALSTTILLGWQIISYIGFKDEVKKEMEKTKAELKEATNNIDNMIQQKIIETQNVIYKKNELYIQGSIAYLESYAKILKDDATSNNYSLAYANLVTSLSYFCEYGCAAEGNIDKCLSALKHIISDFDNLSKQRYENSPFNQYIQKNFTDLEFSKNYNFERMKAGILESNKTGIPQEYIVEFLEIEEERKRIVEQNKLSIAKWETKMKLDNQSKNKAPANKE